MIGQIQIVEIGSSDIRLELLAEEATAQGYQFMDRLLSESKSGANCFDKEGEVFCGAFLSDELVGCGGINIDPYSDQRVGRLRHVFVSEHFRRNGVASALVHSLLERGKSQFSAIRLRTSDEQANQFYDALGFTRTSEKATTHVIWI